MVGIAVERTAMRQTTSTTLALCLSLAAAGCAVLPMAVDRTALPSTRAALAGLKEARTQLDAANTVYTTNMKAAGQRPRDAHGSTSGAYTRWSDDEVKELPAVTTIVTE